MARGRRRTGPAEHAMMWERREGKGEGRSVCEERKRSQSKDVARGPFRHCGRETEEDGIRQQTARPPPPRPKRNN
jgi:hypothetical protein